MTDKIFYPHLMHMTPNQLHNYLEGKKNYTADMKAGIKQVVKRQQDERANRNRSKYQVRKYWEPLINDLQKEMRKLRACAAYTPSTDQPERQQAIALYRDTLSALHQRFKNAKAEGLTPNKLREALKEQGKTIPNDGAHWTDWVTPKKRLAVEVAFDAVPQAYRARRITPFALPSNNNQPGQNSVQPIPQPAQPTQPKE